MSSSRTSNHITHEYKELAFLHGITDLPATPPEASVPLPLPGSALVPSSLPGGCPDVEDSTWALGTLGAHLTRKVPRRRLVITKQPSSEFYKDEGGKANALSVEVSLLEYDENGAKIRTPDDQFVDIPLRVELRFESGKVVDPSEEIFRFVGSGYDANVIRASDRKALILFRLEKVSRRKDGQRFKLLIEADQEQCTANVSDLSGVFTNAICVLSKRKHHHHHHHHHQSHQADTMPREPPAKQARITDAQRM
ncbi:TPA: hypothetical protein N0F65_003901 [Lagenidium giganteum]|uniref:Uncharacterized protein n=1 Tax=Lagenidium giganteum TaxID=4803 RepID=A0AAV2ZA56_9STRA|nr:TPA: hypothetical protein N0F65_003901 [Lagenidium giganteum]